MYYSWVGSALIAPFNNQAILWLSIITIYDKDYKFYVI